MPTHSGNLGLGAPIKNARDPVPNGPKPDDAGQNLDDDATSTLEESTFLPDAYLREGCEVGRYRVGRTLGRGGMGVVYEAFDPQLDRRVALKLVTFAGGTAENQQRARDRTLREAQALALLSHPNVVTVYDVGTIDGAVFIAMEHVEGLTLTDWISRDKPPLKEIIRTYCAAGEGLAAAHRAGLVHRDFKPQNVLLGSDGRVRVIDFGVARATEDVLSSVSVTSSASVGPDGLAVVGSPEVTMPTRSGLSRLTVHGTVVGTPRYMSPEQRESKVADARADQFCFCASLCEAVCEVVPAKEGSDLARTLEAARNGKTIPRWLRKVLIRGLASDPAGRFPSMDALLAELRRDRRAWLARATVVLAVMVAVGAVSFASFREGPEVRCRRGSKQARQMWTQEAQAHFYGVLSGAGARGAGSLYKTVSKGLGRFFDNYEASYTQACEASFVRGAQSSGLLDMRMRCLARRRLQVESLVQGAGDGATSQTLQRIPEALAHLANVAHCDDIDSLQQVAPKPTDPALAAQVERLEREVDRVEGLTLAGKYQDADELIRATYAKVQTLEYAPLRAQTLLRMAEVDELLARYDDALDHLRGAALSAASTKDFAHVAGALIHTIDVHVRKSELDEGLALRFPTELLLASQADNPLLHASYHNAIGNLHYRKSEFKEAETSFRKALELRSSAKAPDDIDTAHLLVSFSYTLSDRGKAAEAKRVMIRAVEMAEERLGPDNINMGRFLANLATLYAEEGDAERAAELDARVLGMRRATLGEKHPLVGLSVLNLGCSLVDLGRWDEAEELIRTALSILQTALLAEDEHLAGARVSYASVAYERGDYPEALRRYADAIAKMRTQGHAESDSMVAALDATAVTSLVTGQLELAATSIDEALRLSTKIYGEAHHSVAHALATRARLALLQGRASDARRDASRVLELREQQAPQERDAKDPIQSLSIATAHFVLAHLAGKKDLEGARHHVSAAEALMQGETKREAINLLAQVEQLRHSLP